MSVLDQALLGCAGNSSGSHLPFPPHQDQILIFWAQFLEGRITIIDSSDGRIFYFLCVRHLTHMIFVHSHHNAVGQVLTNPFHRWEN